MKTAFLTWAVLLWAAVGQGAIEPVVEILHPNSSDQLQPGSHFRFEWRVLDPNYLDRGDWNFFLETNGVQVGRLFADATYYDGTGHWHADLTIPNEVRPTMRFDEPFVELPSNCAYTLRLHEDVTEAEGSSEVFCLGVPVASVRVSQVDICWNARSNRAYQVQFRFLTTNAWTNLGPPMQGNGATNCVTESIAPGQAPKFYRIKELP
jgi:hypothetical protein